MEDYGNRKKLFVCTRDLKLVVATCFGLVNLHIYKQDDVQASFESMLEMFCASQEIIKLHWKGWVSPKLSTI